MIFKINGFDCEIIECKDCDEVFINKDCGEMRVGLCDFVKHKIYIHKDLSPVMKRRVLGHELTHFFLFLHGISTTTSDEETICEFVTIYCGLIVDILNQYFKERGEDSADD